MIVRRKVKDTLAQLVRDLGASRVLQGIPHYPTEIDTYGLGPVDLDHWLSRFLDREIMLIVLPIGGPRARLRSSKRGHRAQGREHYCEGGAQ